MTDLNRWGLRGPVQSCRLQRTWYSQRCSAEACETEERSDATDLEFRADGKLARQVHRNPDGSEFTKVEQYDDAGIAESYEYDATGRKKKILHVDPGMLRSGAHYAWDVEEADALYSAPGATSATTLYNERDQPTEMLFHDEAGRQLSRVEFRYDDAGHLVEEAQINEQDALPAEMLASLNPMQMSAIRASFSGSPRTHRYDGKGRRIETRTCMGPFMSETKTMAYNDYGDEIQEVCEAEHREFSIDEEGRLSDSPIRETATRSEVRFHYEYDDHGNWTKKTIEGRRADDDFSVSSIERRTITYF